MRPRKPVLYCAPCVTFRRAWHGLAWAKSAGACPVVGGGLRVVRGFPWQHLCVGRSGRSGGEPLGPLASPAAAHSADQLLGQPPGLREADHLPAPGHPYLCLGGRPAGPQTRHPTVREHRPPRPGLLPGLWPGPGFGPGAGPGLRGGAAVSGPPGPQRGGPRGGQPGGVAGRSLHSAGQLSVSDLGGPGGASASQQDCHPRPGLSAGPPVQGERRHPRARRPPAGPLRPAPRPSVRGPHSRTRA